MGNSGFPANSSVFGCRGIVLHVHVEDDGELIVHVVTLHSLQPYFLRNHLPVTLVKHVLLFAAHGTDDMARGIEDTLDKGVLTRRDLGPVGKGVALQIGVEIQQVIPAMRDTVDDDYFHARTFADTDGIDVFLRVVGFREGKYVVGSQMGIEVCTAVLGIDNGDFRPVGSHTAGQQQAGIGLARTRCPLQGQPHLGCPAL